MPDRLDQAVEAARDLPKEVRDEIAHEVIRLASEARVPYQLSEEEIASMAESRAQAARGEFATDEEVEAILAKHR